MYSIDIQKENIAINVAKGILMIADMLDLVDLIRIVIVKFILTQISKDDVIDYLKIDDFRNINDES